jgi:hypothetical protein
MNIRKFNENLKEKFTYYISENINEYIIIRKYQSGFEEYVVKINKSSYKNKEEVNKIKDIIFDNLNRLS